MLPKARTAIVILNYLNSADTIECIESAFRQEGDLCGIVVVDNASDNGAYERLKQRFASEQRVTLLQTTKNLGFAKGNNVGIAYARKQLKADFVLVINNDTILIDAEYIAKMLAAYKPGIGVLGSKILLPGNVPMGRFTVYTDWESCLVQYVNFRSGAQGACFDFPLDKSRATVVLHGCALLFTPDFFRYYKGFYPKTFLYREETILYLMCRWHGLNQKYVSETSIFHKEDRSSEMSFSNSDNVRNRYLLQSHKYVLWWLLKCTVLHCGARKKNEEAAA